MSWTLHVRADGGPSTGYGHLHRSLAVIDALQQITDIDVRFYPLPDDDTQPLQDHGFEVERLPSSSMDEMTDHIDPKSGPLLIDSYRHSEQELRDLRNAGYCLVQFDDGCRFDLYDASLVIDSSAASLSLPYQGRPDSVFLLGPAYFPLRSEIRNATPRNEHPEDARRLLLTFGGSDPGDASEKTLQVVEQDPWWERIDVILGPGYQGMLEQGSGREGRVEIVRDPEDYVDRVERAELTVCGAGLTSWEFAYLGLPMMLLELSEDQQANVKSFEDAKAAVNLGSLTEFDPEWLRRALEEVRGDRALREMLAGNGRALIDGHGASRIAQEITALWDRWKKNG